MSAPTQWEYVVYRMNNVNGNIGEILAAHGDDGWELVALHPQPPHLNFVFKRPKAAK